MKKIVLFIIIAALLLVIILVGTRNTGEVESPSQDEQKIKQELSALKSENEDLKNGLEEYLDKYSNSIANSSVNVAVLYSAEIKESLRLSTENVYFDECGECEYGYKSTFDGAKNNYEISDDDYAPIYMFDKNKNFVKVDWEYLVKLDYIPLLKLYDYKGEIKLIKEQTYPPLFEEELKKYNYNSSIN